MESAAIYPIAPAVTGPIGTGHFGGRRPGVKRKLPDRFPSRSPTLHWAAGSSSIAAIESQAFGLSGRVRRACSSRS
jgi:hypothetical protein